MLDPRTYTELARVPPDLRVMELGRRPSREEMTVEIALVSSGELFRDEDDVPYIRLPVAAGGGLWALAAPRVRGWLADICWQYTAELLKPGEADAVLRVLDGLPVPLFIDTSTDPNQLPARRFTVNAGRESSSVPSEFAKPARQEDLQPRLPSVYLWVSLPAAKQSVGCDMGKQCEVCGKKPQGGNTVQIRGKAKYLGGVGTKVTGISRRRFEPNLQRIRVTVGRGTAATMRVCVQCIRSGAIVKRVKAAPFKLPTAKT